MKRFTNAKNYDSLVQVVLLGMAQNSEISLLMGVVLFSDGTEFTNKFDWCCSRYNDGS